MTWLDRVRLRANRRAWERLGATDPLWAILSDPAKRGGRWDESAFFETGRVEVAEVMSLLKQLEVMPARGLAIDFGCGVGRASRALAAEFASVIGLDVSASMIAEGERLNAGWPNLEFRQNAGPTLASVSSGSVDLVYSRLVLQHIPPRLALGYVKEFIRVLAPGGVAVFGIPAHDPRGFKWVRDALRPLREMLLGRGRMTVEAIPRATVESVIQSSGAKLVTAASEEGASGWPAFLYVVRRAR